MSPIHRLRSSRSNRATVIAALALSQLSACSTMEMVKGTGQSAASGDLSGVALGIIATPFALITDVFTLGGLTKSDKAKSSSSAGQADEAKADEAAPNPRERLQRDIDFARTSEQMLVSMRKDASGIRMQRQALERQLAELDMQQMSATTGRSRAVPSTDSLGNERVSLASDDQAQVDAMAASGCKPTLAHLAPRIPDYPVKEIRDVRQAILREDLRQTLARARSMGYSPSKAAAESFAAAKNAEQQAEVGKTCIRQYAADPDAEVRRLEAGRYRFTKPSYTGMPISETCAGSYVVLRATAIALRESAIQMACVSTSGQP